MTMLIANLVSTAVSLLIVAAVYYRCKHRSDVEWRRMTKKGAK